MNWRFFFLQAGEHKVISKPAFKLPSCSKAILHAKSVWVFWGNTSPKAPLPKKFASSLKSPLYKSMAPPVQISFSLIYAAFVATVLSVIPIIHSNQQFPPQIPKEQNSLVIIMKLAVWSKTDNSKNLMSASSHIYKARDCQSLKFTP